jgi:4-carboxymuconolactone decarboxylase
MGEKYERGLEFLRTIAGEHADQLIANLDATAPGFAKVLVPFAFVDVCGRPGLDMKTRELITVAALAANGNAGLQLKLHIGGALNVGCTPTEIVEVLVQISLYAGIPATLNSLAIAGEEFKLHAAKAAMQNRAPAALAAH